MKPDDKEGDRLQAQEKIGVGGGNQKRGKKNLIPNTKQ